MHDHSYLCLQIRNNQSYFHRQCSLHRRQEFRLLPETYRTRTCTQSNGDKFRLLQTSSGPRWSREYLPCLQHRQKWTVPRRNLQVEDLVLLRDKQIARNCWPMARISAVFPGKDGHVRKVEVTTTDQGNIKTFLRPIAEVVLLLPKD